MKLHNEKMLIDFLESRLIRAWDERGYVDHPAFKWQEGLGEVTRKKWDKVIRELREDIETIRSMKSE